LTGPLSHLQDRNVILAHTYEYRLPSQQRLAEQWGAGAEKVEVDMTSRYLGLVVVPGQFITKIEAEEGAR